MRGPRGEAVLFGTANPENEADGPDRFAREGKNALKRREMVKKQGVFVNKSG